MLIWTNVHYKETNAFDYLSWDSHHPRHIKENIPYCLAKRIIVITSKEDDVKTNLAHLQKCLLARGYPLETIKRGFHNAQLQGPAPPKSENKLIPLISTYYSNYSNKTVIEVAKQLITTSKDERVKKAFKDTNFLEAYKQPPNLLRLISNSAFINNGKNRNSNVNEENTPEPKGLHKCSHPRCKICLLYIQEGDSFVTANGTTWTVRCYADCNSRNVLYYLECNFCNGDTTYTGKTDNFRKRTNSHISDIRCNRGADFDEHVRNCAKNNDKILEEPFFKARIFMVLKDYNNLLDYEGKLHAAGHDTMNCPNTI